MLGWVLEAGLFRESPPSWGPCGSLGCSVFATLDIHIVHISASLYTNWGVGHFFSQNPKCLRPAQNFIGGLGVRQITLCEGHCRRDY